MWSIESILRIMYEMATSNVGCVTRTKKMVKVSLIDFIMSTDIYQYNLFIINFEQNYNPVLIG